MSTTPPGTVLPGTLELLVLRALATGELHGLGIARRIQQMTKGVFDVKAGSLFPALHRMERAGWLRSAWDQTDDGRRARFYELTAAGRRQLDAETQHWRKVIGALTHALRGTP
jgi:transcriptional regulator